MDDDAQGVQAGPDPDPEAAAKAALFREAETVLADHHDSVPPPDRMWVVVKALAYRAGQMTAFVDRILEMLAAAHETAAVTTKMLEQVAALSEQTAENNRLTEQYSRETREYARLTREYSEQMERASREWDDDEADFWKSGDG